MALRKFGLEEAKRAGEFAKNKEQRSTVLAVTRLFNIPIVLKKEAAKVIAKAELAFKNKRAKLVKIDKKVIKIELAARAELGKKTDALLVHEDWDI